MNVAALPTRSQRTRAQIIAVAARLFWVHNYHGVSIEDLAEATALNKATIYRYFSDKRDLALAVVRFNGAYTLETFFDASFAAHSAPEDRLAEIFRRAFLEHRNLHETTGDSHGCPLLGLALELGGEMPEIRAEAQRVFNEVERRFGIIARSAMAARGLDGEPEALARTFTQLMHGGFASARIANDPARILDAGRSALALIGWPDLLQLPGGDDGS